MITFYNEDTEFKDKPNAQSGKITNNLNKKISKNQITTVNEYWELLNIIEKGKTILPAIFKDSIKEENFISQQLVFLDFDNTDANNYISIEDIRVDPFIETYAYLVYKTYSHTEKHNKFRVVFCLDKPCTDLNDIKKLILGLLTRYPQADQSCKNVTRHYYATNKISNIIYRNLIDLEKLNNELEKEYNLISYSTNKDKRYRDSYEKQESFIDFSKIKTDTKNKEIMYNNMYENYINNKLIVPDMPVYEMIQEGLIQEALNKVYRKMKNNLNYKDLYNFTYSNHVDSINNYAVTIDLIEFFEIPMAYNNPNSCYDILSDDTKPSASVYQHAIDDVYLYKVFKDGGRAYDIQNLLIALNPKVFSPITAADFILACFESKIVFNGRLYRISQNLKTFLNLLGEPSQSEQYPETWKRFVKNHKEATEILRYMESRMAIDGNGEVQYYIFTSQNTIAKYLLGTHLKDSSSDKIKNTIALLKALFVIVTLSEKQRSEKLSEWYNEKRERNIYLKNYTEHRRKLDHLIFNPESNLMVLVEAQAKLLNQNKISNKNISARTLNNIANGWGDTVFPQHEPKTKQEELKRIDYNNFYNDCIKIIQKELKKNTYIKEETLKKQLIKLQYKDVGNLLRSSRTDFLNMYGLSMTRANKNIKEQLGIPKNKRDLKTSPNIYYYALNKNK